MNVKRKLVQRMMLPLNVIKICFAIEVVFNLMLPLHNKLFGLDIFNLFIIGFWGYGTLCALGFFKIAVATNPDGSVIFETNTPILQILVIRTLQGGFFLVYASKSMNWKIFAFMCFFDIITLIIHLSDKSKKYYKYSGGK